MEVNVPAISDDVVIEAIARRREMDLPMLCRAAEREGFAESAELVRLISDVWAQGALNVLQHELGLRFIPQAFSYSGRALEPGESVTFNFG